MLCGASFNDSELEEGEEEEVVVHVDDSDAAASPSTEPEPPPGHQHGVGDDEEDDGLIVSEEEEVQVQMVEEEEEESVEVFAPGDRPLVARGPQSTEVPHARDEAVEFVFFVTCWGVVFGITDAGVAFDAEEEHGGFACGLKPLGPQFYATEDAFSLRHSHSLKPLGLYEAYPEHHPIEHGFTITMRLDWATRMIYFAVPGMPHVTAPKRLPPEVQCVAPWVHAGEGTSSARVTLLEVRRGLDPGPPLPPPHRVSVLEPATSPPGPAHGSSQSSDEPTQQQQTAYVHRNRRRQPQPPPRQQHAQGGGRRKKRERDPFGDEEPNDDGSPSSPGDEWVDEEGGCPVRMEGGGERAWDGYESSSSIKSEPHDGSQALESEEERRRLGELWKALMEERPGDPRPSGAAVRLRASVVKPKPPYVLEMCHNKRDCRALFERIKKLERSKWLKSALGLLEQVHAYLQSAAGCHYPAFLKALQKAGAPREDDELAEVIDLVGDEPIVIDLEEWEPAADFVAGLVKQETAAEEGRPGEGRPGGSSQQEEAERRRRHAARAKEKEELVRRRRQEEADRLAREQQLQREREAAERARRVPPYDKASGKKRAADQSGPVLTPGERVRKRNSE